jgi:hypothetical protein
MVVRNQEKAVSVSRYLHSDARGVRNLRRVQERVLTDEKRLGGVRPRGGWMDSHGVEPRDPLELLVVAGEREEFVERSFWQDAEADGVTFEESRVDGKWNPQGGEPWK